MAIDYCKQCGADATVFHNTDKYGLTTYIAGCIA